ncbi:hypothetical protein A3I27_04355 [Candidatus Giovannonibacteria bacterium RIFCSPLOWO2_02_FULL_43_11b]|nr:MAG: hypothetical protein A3I27_04355 [Candidatus Giovannonibacteria bacterium RIFCSPLOWO2_02_FULL_43_11b]
MTDYRIQVTATKATWVGDKAYYELTARIVSRRKSVVFPEGEFITFDPGGHRKQVDNKGMAFLRLSTDRQGVFTTTASLESDPDVHDEVEVVVPEKPISASKAKKKAEDDKARAESAESLKKIREARKKPGVVQVLHDEEKLLAEIRESRQKGLPTPQKLGEPAISFPGTRGNYRLNVFVQNDDGQPVAGVPVSVTVSIPTEYEYPREFTTDAHGRVNEPFLIEVEGTVVIVRVRGKTERFDYLEVLPPPPLTVSQRWGLGIGLSLFVTAILIGFWLSTMAP